MKLKSQLKFFLTETGMTATQLAKKSGVPKQSLSNWLAGSNPRDIKQIKKVANALGISVDELVFSDGRPTTPQKNINMDALLGDDWVAGFFEIKIRRIQK